MVGITIDTDAWALCKQKGFNISKICNEAVIIASGLPLDHQYNTQLQAKSQLLDQIKIMAAAQEAKVIELEAKQKTALNEFKDPSKVSNTIIETGHEHALREWASATGRMADELRAIKQEAIYSEQRNKVSFPPVNKDELIKDLKKQGLKSDVI